MDKALRVILPGYRLKESEGKVSVLAFHQQRNAHIGYDLKNNLFSLAYSGACPDDTVDFRQR